MSKINKILNNLSEKTYKLALAYYGTNEGNSISFEELPDSIKETINLSKIKANIRDIVYIKDGEVKFPMDTYLVLYEYSSVSPYVIQALSEYNEIKDHYVSVQRSLILPSFKGLELEFRLPRVVK
jgi:hypothetical protein